MKKKEKPVREKTSDTLTGLKREVLELTTLYEIAKTASSSLNLEEVMSEILDILHRHMGMERGTLTLLDDRTHELIIEVARGLDDKAIERGRYRVGEGITGKVVAAGEPIVVPNVGDEPLFLNRTGSRGDVKRSNISFICVPIKWEQKTIGALSVDQLFQENVSFEEDVRLLTIISSMIAQTVHIHLMQEREKERLQSENIELRRELKKKFHPANIIGESKRMADVYASIELVSQSRATVMLRGESGTGKELVAHAIHYNSERANGPFIKVSCAALPETLLESELFGYEKGAFTGAAITKIGRFEMANKGTLFLDEIGDIAPSTQIKLLRVLQEREFERLGGTQTIRVDLRLITATNRNLEDDVRAGKFREDLYYRLNVIPIFMPSLRERREDIPLLVNHFLVRASEENRKKVRFVSDEAMEYLMNYAWPGNVRELENAIERAVILCKTDILTPDLFPFPKDSKGPGLTSFEPQMPEETKGVSLPEAVEEMEKRMISQALDKTDGNKRKAAKLLGMTERMIGYKIQKYGLIGKLQN
ncbi:MAG: nif-specific transcriptional activator NifA [Candidatus Omnitrophica bacterium]|nr:nif-specific transcriptional activator NifA [Candidatus Omnitrophota bacterium]